MQVSIIQPAYIVSNEEPRQSLFKSYVIFLRLLGSFIDVEISKVSC